MLTPKSAIEARLSHALRILPCIRTADDIQGFQAISRVVVSYAISVNIN